MRLELCPELQWGVNFSTSPIFPQLRDRFTYSLNLSNRINNIGLKPFRTTIHYNLFSQPHQANKCTQCTGNHKTSSYTV